MSTTLKSLLKTTYCDYKRTESEINAQGRNTTNDVLRYHNLQLWGVS